MMSDNILSQEEIEALLRGEPLQSDEPADSTNKKIVTSDYLDEMEKDALGEIGNISFGSSATALSALLGQKVEITTPTISVVDKEAMLGCQILTSYFIVLDLQVLVKFHRML